MEIIPKRNTIGNGRGVIKEYSKYSNEEFDVTYYFREDGKLDNGLKKFYTIQKHNGKADYLNELEMNELIEFMSLSFVGIVTEQEIMREGTQIQLDESEMENLK